MSFRVRLASFLLTFLFLASTPVHAQSAEGGALHGGEITERRGVVSDALDRGTAIAPRRQGGHFEFELGVAVGRVPWVIRSTALTTSAAVTYRGERPLYASARLGPTGGVIGEPARIASGSLTTGLDLRFFSLGLGAGVARAHDTERYPCEQFDCLFFDESGPKATLVFEMRLGAQDGLNLGARLVHALPGGIPVGGLELSAQLPLTGRVAARGRANAAIDFGYLDAELALRARVRGDGDHGSVYVSAGGTYTGYMRYDAGRTPGFYNGFGASFAFEYRP